MTREEQMEIYTAQSVKLIKAHVAGEEAARAVDKAATDWATAAIELSNELGEVEVEDIISPADQYAAFLAACEIAGIDPNHPALASERNAFGQMSDDDARDMLAKLL